MGQFESNRGSRTYAAEAPDDWGADDFELQPGQGLTVRRYLRVLVLWVQFSRQDCP